MIDVFEVQIHPVVEVVYLVASTDLPKAGDAGFYAQAAPGLFVFGLASLVWPPLKVVIGSVTTSAALMLGGVALMVLPSLIVGNELLILGGVAVAVGGWFLAHRHGQLRGVVAASSAVKSDA